MKILLLHPGDDLPEGKRCGEWDTIVDFGRAPASTYDSWSKQTGCRVMSLFDFSEDTHDLRRCRDLLRLGMGHLIDGQGLDWWDVVSLELVPDLLQLMLTDRLAKLITTPYELYSSRPLPLATFLEKRLGVKIEILASVWRSAQQRVRHYAGVLSRLNSAQLAQVVQDKFDPFHSMRRRLYRRRFVTNRRPIILLPSAYVNVSRAAVSYAELVPNYEFLLVWARRNARLGSLPANVRAAPLDSYFRPTGDNEADALQAKWRILKPKLLETAVEFRDADSAGMLDRIPSRLRWAVRIGAAWNNVFESENITGCLCADDTNPYTRIPLMMAKNKGIPTLACHHGALDSWMTLKTLQADFYLAKCEMEDDYLQRVCGVEEERIALARLTQSRTFRSATDRGKAPWLVFFTEPYQTAHWRSGEVYRELLPKLWELAQSCGLTLVFKLHPFESVKSHRRILRRYLPEHERRIEIVAGPPSAELWRKTRVAMTVQSSTALECAEHGIPVFLCAWLRDSYSGYVRQYARFGVGQVLESAEQIAEIPRLLETYDDRPLRQSAPPTIDSVELVRLFAGTYSLPVARRA